jgi:hypothetical protein
MGILLFPGFLITFESDEFQMIYPMVTRLDVHDPRWMELITADPISTLFHHPKWIDLLTESYHYSAWILAITNKAGEVEAGIPIVQTRNIFGREKWVSLPFTDHCAPISKNDQSLNHLMDYLENHSQLNPKLNIELRWNYSKKEFIQKITNYDLFRVYLSSDEHDVANRINPKYFRQIKIAYRRGVKIETGTTIEHVKSFYRLHTLTRKRKGIPVQPWRFFELLWRDIITTGAGFIILAYDESECLAGAVFLNWNRTLIYKYSASIEKARSLLAMDPILWTAIRWGCQNGFSVLDMGRTDIEDIGLSRFKQRWGAEKIPLTYTNLGSNPSTKINDTTWMPILKKTIKHSPTWIGRTIGEIFYRFSG